MARKHHYKRRRGNDYEIDVTTFLNLMVVLVPFLLITAVFSQLTIVELDLPSNASSAAQQQESFRLEVIVRESGIEISNGTATISPNAVVFIATEILADNRSGVYSRCERKSGG